MQESNSDNISLIYEFNQDSPLFARVALEEIENGNYSKAKEILDDGISKYPNYPTAYFIYSSALAYLSEYDSAEEAAIKGGDILGSDETKEFYLKKIEEIKNQHSIVEKSHRVSFLDDDDTGSDAENPSPDEKKDDLPIEERLEELAQQLEKAKIKPPAEEDMQRLTTQEFTEEIEEKDYISFGTDDTIFEESDLASETMAMIFEGQGKYREAQKIYEKLKKIEPDKADIFDLKIAEIEQKIAGQS